MPPPGGVYGETDGDGNGVYGHASDSAASGVYGENDSTGFGVAGRASGGVGALGDSVNRTAVAASVEADTQADPSGLPGPVGLQETSRACRGLAEATLTLLDS